MGEHSNVLGRKKKKEEEKRQKNVQSFIAQVYLPQVLGSVGWGVGGVGGGGVISTQATLCRMCVMAKTYPNTNYTNIFEQCLC